MVDHGAEHRAEGAVHLQEGELLEYMGSWSFDDGWMLNTDWLSGTGSIRPANPIEGNDVHP